MQQKTETELPTSNAIAGAWGYIGRKFLDAASALGITAYAYDPGDLPADVDAARMERITDQEQFYRLPVPFFHLALHPEHRRRGLEVLLERGRSEPLLILCEKPMAAPECPEDCDQMVEATGDLAALVLFDFPELFDGLTRRIHEYMAGFREVHITEIRLWRSKDREDAAIPRNYKRMVTIQYQESVHCLAFILSILGNLRGSLQAVLEDGVSVSAEAETYDPPNPQDYRHVVDGRCQYQMTLGDTTVRGTTNFKSGAEWTKRRTITGTADGRPFRIEAEYLEGHKRLVINGVDQECHPQANSYEEAIMRAHVWHKNTDRQHLMTAVYPNPHFARVTYQLSSVLWRSSTDNRPVWLGSMQELIDFDAMYRERMLRLPYY